MQHLVGKLIEKITKREIERPRFLPARAAKRTGERRAAIETTG